MYKIFLDRLPQKEEEILDENRNYLVTYMNPFNYITARKHVDLFRQYDYITSDGIIFVKLLNTFFNTNITRISPDLSSYFKPLFQNALKNNSSVYIVGSTNDSIETAVKNITKMFDGLNMVGHHSGYFNAEEREELIRKIVVAKPEIVIVGMGTILQEKFLVDLKDAGWIGKGHCCGGFIHQTATKMEYYPSIINKLHLRWLYRIFKEPKLIKRYGILYPYALFLFLYDKFKTQ